jgi:hypothetical protein
LARTEDQYQQQQPQQQQQQQQQQYPDSMRASPQQQRQPSPRTPTGNSTLVPPPRPPRDGVGLGNSQRNTIAMSVNEATQSLDSLIDEQRRTQVPLQQEAAVPTESPMEQHQHQQQQQQQQQERVVPRHSSVRNMKPSPSPVPPSPATQMPNGQVAPSQPAAAPAANHINNNNNSISSNNSSSSNNNNNAAATEERQALLREIKSRDAIISEMKKKENWWRTEVSMARKMRASKGETFDDGPEADEALLMDMDHLAEDKVTLFEQLVAVKSELRRVRASILQQAQPMSDKVSQADRMRTAALQEAAYFKSKYMALKERRQDELDLIEQSRCDELEKRLATALADNEANNKMLQQLQKRAQHDLNARTTTEERAKEAQSRAEEAQEAHQRALEELQMVYTRATKAETQVRENAVQIAELTQQLSEALSAQSGAQSHEASEAHLKAAQLEAANLRARNESAALQQKLAEGMDDIARLRTLLAEREDALTEAKVQLEDAEIQLSMMREAIQQKNTGYSSTRAY